MSEVPRYPLHPYDFTCWDNTKFILNVYEMNVLDKWVWHSYYLARWIKSKKYVILCKANSDNFGAGSVNLDLFNSKMEFTIYKGYWQAFRLIERYLVIE